MRVFNKVRETAMFMRTLNTAVIKGSLDCLEDTENYSPEERAALVDKTKNLLDENANLEAKNCKLERSIGQLEGICWGGGAALAGMILGTLFNALTKSK